MVRGLGSKRVWGYEQLREFQRVPECKKGPGSGMREGPGVQTCHLGGVWDSKRVLGCNRVRGLGCERVRDAVSLQMGRGQSLRWGLCQITIIMIIIIIIIIKTIIVTRIIMQIINISVMMRMIIIIIHIIIINISIMMIIIIMIIVCCLARPLVKVLIPQEMAQLE